MAFKRINETDPIPKGYWVIGYLWAKDKRGRAVMPEDPIVCSNDDVSMHDLIEYLGDLFPIFHVKREIHTYKFTDPNSLRTTTNKPKSSKKPKKKRLTRTQRKKLPTIA